MHEFSDRPLVAGSLTGVRSFCVGAQNMLTGCVHRTVWKPGVNVATCQGGTALASWAQALQQLTEALAAFSRAFERGTGIPPSTVTPTREAEPHHVAQLGCQCGFYAYLDARANPYRTPGNIVGLIEGTGVATVGSRGFRVEKARIVALVRNENATPLGMAVVPVKFSAVSANYPDVPVFPTIDAALAEFPLTPTSAPPAPSETLFERAMRRRRERNTGPANTTGLDGTRRSS